MLWMEMKTVPTSVVTEWHLLTLLRTWCPKLKPSWKHQCCVYGECEDNLLFGSFLSPWCQTPCPVWTCGLCWVSWIPFRQQPKSRWGKPIQCLGPSVQVLRGGLIYYTACVLLHVRWWLGANFCMCWPLCPIWNLTAIIFTHRTMKLYIIFFLAVVNKQTSNYQPPEGTSCEMVRLSLYLGPLRSWMRLGPPCYRHCTSSYSLWEGKPPGPGFLGGRGGICRFRGCLAVCHQAVSL